MRPWCLSGRLQRRKALRVRLSLRLCWTKCRCTRYRRRPESRASFVGSRCWQARRCGACPASTCSTGPASTSGSGGGPRAPWTTSGLRTSCSNSGRSQAGARDLRAEGGAGVGEVPFEGSFATGASRAQAKVPFGRGSTDGRNVALGNVSAQATSSDQHPLPLALLVTSARVDKPACPCVPCIPRPHGTYCGRGV